MSKTEIEKILNNAAHSMELEGFKITKQQRQECAAALAGRGSFDDLIKKYIQEAKNIGSVNA